VLTFRCFFEKTPDAVFFIIKITLHHGARQIEKWCTPVYGAGVFFIHRSANPGASQQEKISFGDGKV
jgi:hypothetical protein